MVKGDSYQFAVRLGKSPAGAEDGTKAARGSFRCVLSQTPIDGDYIKAEAQAGRMGARLMAIVAEGRRGRVYLSPTIEHENSATDAKPDWKPDIEFFQQALGFRIGNYGMTKWSDLFTSRQLVSLATLSDLIKEVRTNIRQDARATGWADDQTGLANNGNSCAAYSEAVSILLSFALSKQADLGNSLCRWEPVAQCPRQLFGRQAIPMVWDFAEGNPLGESSGAWLVFVDGIVKAFTKTFTFVPSDAKGYATQADAQTQSISRGKVVSTDPPYYDNVGYADLSDFFYVWLRHSLKSVYPELFATVSVPKADELVATPGRHGGKDAAEAFFLEGMTQVMDRLAEQTHPNFPVAIYYAFKQSETKGDTGTSSTGWNTFLDAVLRAGLVVTGTWPVQTENASRMRGQESNALASSIVLVCRPRPTSAGTTSRRAFQRELNQVLPDALDEMTRGSGDGHSPVAPVDLSQAIIGPGMAVFSKYAAALEADGTPMSVRTALQLINRFLAEDDFDHDTQFCLHWFEQHGWGEGKFGEADTLARAKGTSVDGVKHAGVVYASGGIVRLFKWSDYPTDRDAETDDRLPVWELLHQLIRMFKTEGEAGAGKVLAAVQGKAEATRQLAYRLHTLCERAGWAEDARAYNEIVTSWSAIEAAATAAPIEKQTSLFS